MLSLEEAKSRILAALPQMPVEEIELEFSLGRFAASTLVTQIDLPPFDNSAMDGYAVRSDDLKNASSQHDVALRLAGKIGAGEGASRVEPGSCIRIFTGSCLPVGADAVVMQEDTKTEGEKIIFSEVARPFENVRVKGEDVRKGSVILDKGLKINATRRGLLAACGISLVPVIERPRVGLVATGNELREPGEILRESEIYESNRTLLSGFLNEIASVRIFPLVRDDLGMTRKSLEHAFSLCDVIISTGGVSVGELDFIKEAFEAIGGVIDLWKIAVRPGKPFVFGRWKEKFLFGLPGNPVSALVTFLMLVRPALLKMSGAARVELPTMEGEVVDEMVNDGNRRHFMRVRWEAGKVYRAGPQASHMIGSLGEANGLLDVAPEARLERGKKVKVQLWALPDE
jgi:molybdopterin molybdotransferase